MADLTYLSLGAGVQSSALYVLCARGEAPKAKFAIFADTQDEPAYVYEQLDRLEEWGKANGGPPIVRTTAGKLSADVLDPEKGGRTRFVPIPVWSVAADGRENQLRRQCTREYKLAAIERCARNLMGYRKGERIAGKSSATALIGISRDEAQRMKPSRTPWITNVWPLVDLYYRRSDCERIVMRAGLPRPLKSSCVYCPYHDNDYWRWLAKVHPTEFERACQFDESIRNMSKSGEPVYIHRSLLPLRRVDFEDKQYDLFDGFGNECEGMCGV